MATNPVDNALSQMPPVPEDEFCVYGIVYSDPKRADDLATIYAETTRLSASEPGIIYYCISRDGKDPSVFHFFERYTGRKAFEEHNQQPIIQKLMAEKLIKDVKATFAKPIKPIER